ncbi:MAG: PDZ domain-containing protein, partial [Phycisphaerales bacterium]
APGDYSDDTPGVSIGDVYPKTPAADAGLKQGDRITKWNDKSIKDVEQWTEMLRSAKAGEVVTVTFLREKKELTAQVTLTARDDSPK